MHFLCELTNRSLHFISVLVMFVGLLTLCFDLPVCLSVCLPTNLHIAPHHSHQHSPLLCHTPSQLIYTLQTADMCTLHSFHCSLKYRCHGGYHKRRVYFCLIKVIYI